jgi:hypothetical protein
MRPKLIFRAVGEIALTGLCIVSMTADAECVRLKLAPRPPNVHPDFDGPGSFGELQDTVTLDCLKYVGSVQKNGIEHVLIRDEKGKVHVLRPGNFMGENTGVITKIDHNTIYIRQLVPRNGDWEKVVVKFAKQRGAK